jgi:hypothetical protein
MPDVRRAGPAALAALIWAGGLLAQVPPGATPQERALLARADSLYRQVEARRERLRQSERESARGRLVESGGLAAVVPGQAQPDQALGALDTAGMMLRDYGAVPEGFGRSVVVVFENATDTALALAAPLVRGRRRVPVGGIQFGGPTGGKAAFKVPSLVVASVIAVAYRDTRDADWRAWLPGNYGVGPWDRNASWSAFEILTRSNWAVGSRCLAGDVSGCRLWLGVDRDSSPYRARYQADELRDYFGRYSKWFAERSPAGRDCLSGAGSACFEYALEEHHPIPAIPADPTGRKSLVRAVRALHGAKALERALADTAGSVGDRFARSAGIGVDSLMREWRYWVLTRGGRPQDRNLLADAAPAVLLAALLLAVARRSRG